MSAFVLKPFEVSVAGFPPATYSAKTRGKALAAAWGDYRSCSDTSFGDFLRIAIARRTECPNPRYGEEIIVGGRPAFYVGENRQYVQFVLPDSEVILNSHPLDVQPLHPKERDHD